MTLSILLTLGALYVWTLCVAAGRSERRSL